MLTAVNSNVMNVDIMLMMTITILIPSTTIAATSLGECVVEFNACESTVQGTISNATCDCSKCRPGMPQCCSHEGVDSLLLAFEDVDSDAWVDRIAEWNKCTGANVQIFANPGGEDTMANDMKFELEGSNLYDAYIVQGPMLPGAQNYLEDMTPWLKNTSALTNIWTSINAASKQALSYNGTAKAIPMDSDYISLGYRSDLFALHGKSPPDTLEEMVELSEYFDGKDHNNDGEADWGICLTPQANYFYAFVAPILQTDGCSHDGGDGVASSTCNNMYFDTDTMEPLIHNKGFKYAVELMQRFLKASNCKPGMSLDDDMCSRKIAFPTGRCAGVISMPGTMNSLLGGGKYTIDESTNPIDVTNLTGSHWGRRMRFPGTKKVWNRVTDTVDECTTALCPKAVAIDGKGLINFAPFFSEGGEAYTIAKAAGFEQKTVMIEFFAWLATVPLADLPLSGQYSLDQLSTSKKAEYAASRFDSWPANGTIMVEDLFEVLQFYFNGTTNAAQDLFIPGFSDYMNGIEVDLYENYLLDASQTGTEEERYTNFVKALNVTYSLVTNQNDRLDQLGLWRSSLGMASLSKEVICENLNDQLIEDVKCPLPEVATASDETDVGMVVGVCVGVVAVIVLILIVLYSRMSRKLQKQKSIDLKYVNIRVREMMGEQFENSEADAAVDEFEALHVEANNIALGQELGRGAFGIVMAGTLSKPSTGEEIPVAVKMLAGAAADDADEQQDFIFEAQMLAYLKHPGVLKVLAVHMTSIPLMLATEFMRGGDLLQFLRPPCQIPQTEASIPDLMQALHLVADALHYLHCRSIVHRDVAARNVLVGENIRDVRISDFGLSRRMQDGKDYYKKLSDDKIPVKWMSIEAIQFKTYSSASDTFSFGVMAWEVFTFGETPWAALSAVETVLQVAQGKHLRQPTLCPPHVWDVLLNTWALKPEDRASMYHIAQGLSSTAGTYYNNTDLSQVQSATMSSEPAHHYQDEKTGEPMVVEVVVDTPQYQNVPTTKATNSDDHSPDDSYWNGSHQQIDEAVTSATSQNQQQTTKDPAIDDSYWNGSAQVLTNAIKTSTATNDNAKPTQPHYTNVTNVDTAIVNLDPPHDDRQVDDDHQVDDSYWKGDSSELVEKALATNHDDDNGDNHKPDSNYWQQSNIKSSVV